MSVSACFPNVGKVSRGCSCLIQGFDTDFFFFFLSREVWGRGGGQLVTTLKGGRIYRSLGQPRWKFLQAEQHRELGSEKGTLSLPRTVTYSAVKMKREEVHVGSNTCSRDGWRDE